MSIETVIAKIKDALDEAEVLAGVPLTSNQIAVLTVENDALRARALQADALFKQGDALTPDA